MDREQAERTAIGAMEDLIEIIEARRKKLIDFGFSEDFLGSSAGYILALRHTIEHFKHEQRMRDAASVYLGRGLRWHSTLQDQFIVCQECGALWEKERVRYVLDEALGGTDPVYVCVSCGEQIIEGEAKSPIYKDYDVRYTDQLDSFLRLWYGNPDARPDVFQGLKNFPEANEDQDNS